MAEHSGAPANGIAGVAGSIPAPLICDILIKSYPPDYELLRYCMRSIDKFARGFRRTILIIPKGTYAQLSEALSGIEFLDFVNPIEVEETGDSGYLFQQAVKINAHEYTDADYILHIDSDTLLTAPVTPQSFFREVYKHGLGDVTKSTFGQPVTELKPLWLMTPYSHFVQELDANPKLLSGVMAWKPITEKFLGEPVEFEFMRRAPQFIPRSLHVSADVFCRVKHRMSLTQYILSQPGVDFSEFNALGALAYSRARDDFSWLDTTKEELPEAVAKQFWSHDPLTDERRAEFEEILSGPAEGDIRQCPKCMAEAVWHDNEWQCLNPDCIPTYHKDFYKLAGGVAKLADASDLKSDGEIREGSSPSAPIRQTAAGIWIIDGDTHISAWVEEKGQLQHDYQTLPLILAEINDGDTVVDVGANIGDSTAPFLDKVGSQGRVYAFEPNPDAFNCLELNLGQLGNLSVAMYALDQYDGKSFSTLTADVNAGARYLKQSEDGQPVETRTLDSFKLDRCNFIKIDVEGYELKVLRGAEKTINKFRPKMAIELNEGALQRQGTSTIEVLTWIYDHGYNCWPLVPPDRNQELPQYDILCQPLPHWQPSEEEVDWNKFEVDAKPRARGENSGAEAIVPWADKEESLAEVSRLCGELKKFCNAPAHTNRVRQELKTMKVK